MKIIEMSISTLDLEAKILIPTQPIQELSVPEEIFLKNKIHKVFELKHLKKASFKEASTIKALLDSYTKKEVAFEEITTKLSTALFDLKQNSFLFDFSDFIVIKFTKDLENYLLFIDQVLEKKYSHYVAYEEDTPCNRIIEYNAILGESIKLCDRVFLMNLTSGEYLLQDEIAIAHDEIDSIFESVFQVTTNFSDKDVMKLLTKEVTQISKRFELDEMQCIASLKEDFSSMEDISIEEVSKHVFSNNTEACEALQEFVEEKQLPPSLSIDESSLTKKDKVQRILTDTGIEIIVPVSYLNQKDKIEFINCVDGLTSIEIKGIGKIKSR